MKLAIFDFDGTLFPKDTLPFLLGEWKRLGYSKRKYIRTLMKVLVLYVQFKTGLGTRMSKVEMRVLAMEKFNYIFTGMSREDIDLFFSRTAENIIPLLKPQILKELEHANKEGYHTVLLSGAYIDLLEKIAYQLDVARCVGTLMHFEEDMFDYDHPIHVVVGANKIKEIENVFSGQSINWKESIAYADSDSDLEVLESVGTAYAVDPDSVLRREAETRNWTIIMT